MTDEEVLPLRFYFDESVELAVSQQVATNGMDAVSAHSLEKLGDSDQDHLQRAKDMGRVLCTYDTDFLKLAQTITDHAGIVFAPQRKISIGGWVKEIRTLHATKNADEVRGMIIFLSER